MTVASMSNDREYLYVASDGTRIAMDEIDFMFIRSLAQLHEQMDTASYFVSEFNFIMYGYDHIDKEIVDDRGRDDTREPASGDTFKP